ncbi:MAG: metallophosphoesterase family protein [Chloroflexota bacterium]
MKIAVLSDIHANWIALQAVAADIARWGADRVIVAGDTINRGPRPLECWQFVQEMRRAHGWHVLLGNHEEYILEQARPGAPRRGPWAEVHQASYWTYCQVAAHISAIQALPFDLQLADPAGRAIRCTHASLCGTRDGIYHITTDDELETKIGLTGCPNGARSETAVPPGLFLVGHTHIPLVRRLNGTLVVNAGSAGIPFDGDTRPSYARLTWDCDRWQAEIARVPYDLAAAERDFTDSGYLAEAGPLIPLVVIELQQARPQLGSWVDRFQKMALAGEISVANSVRQFLNIG